MGADGVAVDATATRLIGLDPDDVAHLRFAGLWGLGITDGTRIDVRGARLADVSQRYKPAPTNSEDRLS
jgi:hypothetical protein